MLLGGELQINVKKSKFEFVESTLHMKSLSMPLSVEGEVYKIFVPTMNVPQSFLLKAYSLMSNRGHSDNFQNLNFLHIFVALL